MKKKKTLAMYFHPPDVTLLVLRFMERGKKKNPGLNSATIYRKPGGHSPSQMVFGSLNCRISGYFKLGAKCGYQNTGKDCGTVSISIFFSFYFF